MEIELNAIAGHMQQLADTEGISKLAERLDVSRQTVYNILAGGWPTRKVMEKLGMRLVFRDPWKAAKA